MPSLNPDRRLHFLAVQLQIDQIFCLKPMRSAIAGPISMGLSQVILVIGLGSSCSQPLLAKRPS